MLFSRGPIAQMIKAIEPNTPLWELKHNLEHLETLEKGDPYTFNSQLQHMPTMAKGAMFKDQYWKHYDMLPPDIFTIRIYGDTAQKTGEKNDFTVFQCWGKSRSGGIYLIDQARGKWEAPQIESNLVEFWNKHRLQFPKTVGAQKVFIEDKSSGSSLIQSIQQNYNIPIFGIPRHKDKVLRAFGVVSFFASGYIYLPKNCDWVFDYKEEFRKFSPMMIHKHDDQIDPTMDAVEDLLVGSGATDYTSGWVSN